MFGRKKNATTQKKGSGKYLTSEITIGENLNFAGAEAYKLLRTNLEFALPETEGARVIGVTSGLSGEGKSTTSLNLAYTIAETGKRVLLIEADMRLPMLAKRIDVPAIPGLSNLLTGQATVSATLHESGLLPSLYVISGGDVPPNPSEILGSSRMEATVKALMSSFNTIIIDLPPVNVVADALVVSKIIDGMIVVVRQDYASRRSVNDAMRLINLADIKVLGFVMTRAEDHGSYYYRGSYGRDYKYGYSYSAYSKGKR